MSVGYQPTRYRGVVLTSAPFTRVCAINPPLPRGGTDLTHSRTPNKLSLFTIHYLLFTIHYLPFPIYPLPSLSMRRAIYPGSFDPITNGHLDIIERGSKLFDEIIIAILVNPDKQPFFSIEERREMLDEVLSKIDRSACTIRVDDFRGLLVHYAVAQQAHAIVRGIRAISDYEYELQMALMNRRLEPTIETVFMMPAETYSYVSSRLVKEVFQLGGELSGLVPPLVEARMRSKLGRD